MSETVTCRKIDDASGGVWMAERRYSWDHECVDRVYALTMEEALAQLPPPRTFQTYREKPEPTEEASE